MQLCPGAFFLRVSAFFHRCFKRGKPADCSTNNRQAKGEEDAENSHVPCVPGTYV